MQLKYVFSETSTGLRRNVSMTIALIVTIFVSLTLVGSGAMLYLQKNKAEDFWGNKLQITVFLCNVKSSSPHCAGGAATEAQKAAIRQVLNTHPEVKSYYLQTRQQAFRIWKKMFVDQGTAADQAAYKFITPAQMQESYWVTLKNPRAYQGVEQAVGGLDGVDTVRDLHQVLNPIYVIMNQMQWGALGIAIFLLIAAMLEVTNAIRLAAYARRREIGIMRLVGAGNLYILLPFLMETLVAGLIGFAGAALTIAAFVYFVVYRGLRTNSHIVEWIDWGDAGVAILGIFILAVLLTLIPTLVATRKYLKV